MDKNSVIEQVKTKRNTDRISNLPDELLGQILSFLPTKEAVATCILSKRWNHVFTLLTNLDFDDSPISYCWKEPYHIDRSPSFIKYVDYVLDKSQSGNNITRFRLRFGEAKSKHCLEEFYNQSPDAKCCPDLPSMHLRTWMCLPLFRGVKELDLCTRVRKPGYLPFALFRCQTLEVLKLDVNDALRLPKSFYLPNLKVLHLTLPQLPFDEFITSLLSKCPLLEDLALTGEWKLDHPRNFSYAPSLRRLSISNLRYNVDASISDFVLDAPNLEYLEYDDALAIRHSIGNLKSLVEAQICVYYSQSLGDVVFILDLVTPLAHVRRLSLCDECIEALEDSRLELNKLPLFHNLYHLEFKLNEYQFHKVLLELLHVAPVLQTLKFEGLEFHGKENYLNWEEVREVTCEIENLSTIPSCVESHLKRVEMIFYEGIEVEEAVVQYFLRTASVLEEVVLYCNEDLLSKKNMTSLETRLQKLPRRSSTCSIKLAVVELF